MPQVAARDVLAMSCQLGCLSRRHGVLCSEPCWGGRATLQDGVEVCEAHPGGMDLSGGMALFTARLTACAAPASKATATTSR